METNPKSSQWRVVLFGGVLPVAAFTVAEMYYGIFWGLIVGMAFGTGEIIYEWVRHRKVDAITWIGNGLILVLGGLSLLAQDGLWFKMQPAILEVAMAIFLLGSYLLNKPFLILIADKQNLFQKMPSVVQPFMRAQFTAFTFRLSLFFFFHAGLATWAALEWSTKNWALLKGVGFTTSMVVYMFVEVLLIRWRLRRGFLQRK